MCGIAGLWEPGLKREDGTVRVRAMTDALRHRGPDDSGAWIDEAAGIALGHRRLSILDLSERGHQPMVSASGRYAVTYNGEIYNFRRLRTELEACGARFVGDSDTEVLLAAVEEWGLRGAIDRFIGMFAFGLWDRHERTLYLVRDRLGVKPLCYGWNGSTFLFASELGALRADPRFDPEIDVGSIALLTQFSFIPDPWTIHAYARKLPPASWLVVRGPDQVPAPERYWVLEERARSARAHPIRSVRDATEELGALLDDSIELRMISDVPLGAFLSGGIDSSLVVATMQRHSREPVRTFTIGYDEAAYDESDDARRVAQHLGTEHHEVLLRTEDVQAVVTELSSIYDEPFADASQVPTLLVCRFARKHVTVVLTGDGGDELFVGYNRHVWGQRALSIVERVPWRLRMLGQRFLDGRGTQLWDSTYERLDRLLPPALRLRTPGDKIAKLGALLGARDAPSVYGRLIAYGSRDLVANPSSRPGPLERLVWDRDVSFAEASALADARAILPGDPLVKVDRASMSVGLEAREPLLDHRIAETAWRMALDLKVREGVGKWILREVLSERVPRALFERPKMGFGIPVDRWLRAGLRPWAEELLSERSLRETGVFDVGRVRASWATHLAGHKNRHAELWSVLMTQAWLRQHGRTVGRLERPHAGA